MPPLSDQLKIQTLKGFEAVENPNKTPPPVSAPGANLGSNPFIRCPLPPFAVNIDTTRQFNESGKIPARRVIPLSAASQLGGTSSTEAVVTAGSGSSGGGSSGGSTKFTAKTIRISIPLLAPSAAYKTTVSALAAKTFQLLQISSTQALEIRLYGDPNTQSQDIVRPTNGVVPFPVMDDLITDVVLDTVPYIWTWQNRIGANAASPIQSSVYLTAVNPSSTMSALAAAVTLTYLPLET